MDENTRKQNFEGSVEADYSFNENHIVGIKYKAILNPTYKDSIHINNNIKLNGSYYNTLESAQLINYDYNMGYRVNIFYLGKIKNSSIDFNFDYFNSNYTIFTVA